MRGARQRRTAASPPTEYFNRGDNESCGYLEVRQRGGVRLHTGTASLEPVRKRPNLRVLTKAQATRIAGQVLLAAGSVGTPHLLELSGIGDGERLQAFDIGVQRHRPDLGQNLQDDLQLGQAFRVQGTRTLNERARTLWVRRAWRSRMRSTGGAR